MTATRTLLAKTVDREVMVSSAGVALLMGVHVDDVRQVWDTTKGPTCLPDQWVRQGKRRTKEAQAATNSTAMLDALRFWARTDHGAEVTLDAYGSVWLVTDIVALDREEPR